MEDVERSQRRTQLSKTISEKLETVGQLRAELEKMKQKTKGNSVDEQIVIAEMEYRLVKEEMALLSYQEQHWESAALWDLPATSYLTQKEEMWDVLNSYILSLRERGAVPALHTCEHLHLDNSVLVSSSPQSMPKVEWAHHSTELQNGDRLLEVNGQLVMGKESGDVSEILASSKPVCRIVFLRPLSLYQLMKGGNNWCKETSNLRQELTAVVTRLNQTMKESNEWMEHTTKLQRENDELRAQGRKLKLQIVSLQSILLYMLQVVEKDLPSMPSVMDILGSGPVCVLPKRALPSPPEDEQQHDTPLVDGS